MHDSFRLIICVNNTDTSVVIYDDFKENRNGPQYQAYIETTPLNKTYYFLVGNAKSNHAECLKNNGRINVGQTQNMSTLFRWN